MKKRVISALVMMLIGIPAIIFGGIYIKLLISLVGLFCFKEILDIKGVNNYPKFLIVTSLVALFILIYSKNGMFVNFVGLGYDVIAFLFMLLFIPVVMFYKSKKYLPSDAFKLSGFIFYIGIILNIILTICLYRKVYFIYLLVISISTDVFAYLVGSLIGKHKISLISPNKSLEGFIGGLLLGTILGSIFYVNFIHNSSICLVVLFSFILSFACIIGDLFYSAIKRENSIKDFSNLIPGHGGMLDRIDSLTFVVAVYTIIARFI